MSYVMWSHEHDAWWGPDHCGYTRDLEKAGRYTGTEAGKIVVQAHPCGIEVAVPEIVAQRHGTDFVFGIREPT